MTNDMAGEVLDFWFGELDAEGRASAEHRARWWRKDPTFDDSIRQRFLTLHGELAAGQHRDWAESAAGRLAAVIVLDQFSRNMFRDTGRSFATDDQALALAEEGLRNGHDSQLIGEQRVFLRMPLMHSESLAVQERCLASFEALRDELPPGPLHDGVASNVSFAQRHLEIVHRFGRFPHRNALLGRTSTPDEEAFLEQPGSRF